MMLTDEEIAEAVIRMNGRDATWLMKASMLPSVWTTINMGLMGWQMEHYGLIETWKGLARPTELGRTAAEIYCKMSGLKIKR